MKDFNFFETYQVKKELSQKKAVLLLAVVAVLIFAGFTIFTIYSVFEMRLVSLRSELETNQRFLNSPSTLGKLNEHDSLSEQLASLKLYNSTVEKLSGLLLESSFIKTEFLKQIEESIPKDTRIDTLSMASSGEISIDGVSGKRTSIAEFEHSLRALDFVSDVFVSAINKNDENKYGFSMVFSVKGAVSDVRPE